MFAEKKNLTVNNRVFIVNVERLGPDENKVASKLIGLSFSEVVSRSLSVVGVFYVFKKNLKQILKFYFI